MYSFRCASGMFTYINDNFLHAPSTDLSREVIKILIVLMSAQATEIFIEMTKGSGLKSKLCMSVSGMYSSIIEEVKEWVTKLVFIRDWSYLVQVSEMIDDLIRPLFRLLIVSRFFDIGLHLLDESKIFRFISTIS